MRLSAALSWLFFRSPMVAALYRSTIHSRRRWYRWFGFGVIALILSGRSARQFLVPRLATLAAALLLAGGFALLGPLPMAVLLLVSAATAVVLAMKSLPDDHIGHRAGYEDFTGEHCENTVEGLRALAAKDAAGALPFFPYIEFDVQETADNQLVLFHDLTLARAFPRSSANEQLITALEAAGPPFALTTPQDLTLAQLQALHLGGREGVRVPTLRQFLEACAEAGVRRPLAIEVKVLRSDAARQQLLNDISWYRKTHGAELDRQPSAAPNKHPHLGWAGVIAFPHFFARCFGEYGSPQWRRWAAEFHRRGIPARSCHFTHLTLIYTG